MRKANKSLNFLLKSPFATFFFKEKRWVYFAVLLFEGLKLQAQCNPANDRVNLITFYNATNGNSWINNTNWNTPAPISTWYGITIDANGCVTEINLQRNNLTGTLPGAIGNLSQLQVLDLNGCDAFNGQLGFGCGQNNISGSIPSGITSLSNLQFIDLQGNSFSGSIPSLIGNMTNLQSINFSFNNIGGTIPPSLYTLSQLAMVRERIRQVGLVR